MTIIGRASELDLPDRFAVTVRRGLSGVVVLRGEAGIGTTALLDHVAAAPGVRAARVTGLHRLLMPFLPLCDGLVAVQRQAIRVAFGLDAGPPPDR
ncbi:hypothetical protein HerbRD11066_65580 [Herbidospora sp. RD11066]